MIETDRQYTNTYLIVEVTVSHNNIISAPHFRIRRPYSSDLLVSFNWFSNSDQRRLGKSHIAVILSY